VADTQWVEGNADRRPYLLKAGLLVAVSTLLLPLAVYTRPGNFGLAAFYLLWLAAALVPAVVFIRRAASVRVYPDRVSVRHRGRRTEYPRGEISGVRHCFTDIGEEYVESAELVRRGGMVGAVTPPFKTFDASEHLADLPSVPLTKK
jgi:hypothetical protein